MDEVGTGVNPRPGMVFVVEIFYPKLNIWRRPRRLNSGNVAPNDTSAGVFLGHFAIMLADDCDIQIALHEPSTGQNPAPVPKSTIFWGLLPMGEIKYSPPRR